MPVNFQLLNAIQAPQVVGSVPGSAPNNSADSLAGGLMQGLQAGQQMQLNQKQGELLDEQLKNAKGINEQRIKSQEALDQFGREFNQNYDQAVKNLISRDPVAGMKMAQDYQDLKIKQGQAAQNMAEGNKAQMSTLHEIQITGGDMASTAMATATDPQSGQIDWNKANQVYQQLKAPLSKQAPELADLYPAQLTEGDALNLQKIGQEATQQKLSYELKKAGTKDERTATQKDAEYMTELQNKASSGDKQAQQTLQNMGAIQNNQKQVLGPANQIDIQTTSDRLKETGKTANLATQTLTTLEQMEKLTDTALDGRGAGVELKFRQLLTYAGIPVDPKTSATETFNSLVKQNQLTAQTLLKGSSSDRDMEIVAETGPQLYNTKEGRRMMISAAKYKAKMDQQYNAFLNAYKDKNNGSLSGADEGWENFKQSRSDFNEKTKSFDASEVNQKAWAPFLDPNYTMPKAQAEFKEGQVYEDANGNKAKYVKGKWESI